MITFQTSTQKNPTFVLNMNCMSLESTVEAVGMQHPLRFSTQKLSLNFLFTMCPIFSSPYLIILRKLVALILSNSSLWNFLHSPLSFTFLGHNILVSTLLPYFLNMCKVVPALQLSTITWGVLGSGGIAPHIHWPPPALDGGEWSASRPNRFTPREKAPGTRWIGGWMGRG
jgi:hypothetical protein